MIILIKKFNFILIIIFFSQLFVNNSEANFKEKFLNKYKTVNTLSFNFTQKIGKKVTPVEHSWQQIQMKNQ